MIVRYTSCSGNFFLLRCGISPWQSGIGFLFTGLLYWLITHFLGDKLPVMILALVLGLAVCYAFGTAWFMIVYAKNSGSVGLLTALGWCVFPFILPDCVKMALAILIAKRLPKRLIQRV